MGQCRGEAVSSTGLARYIPREAQGSGTTGVRRASPGWATDPNPDNIGGEGGGGGRTGYTPQDEGGGDIGGPGNPNP